MTGYPTDHDVAAADYWREELAAIERLLAMQRDTAAALAPFILGHVAAALNAGGDLPAPAPDHGAALARNWGLKAIAWDDARQRRAGRNTRITRQ